DGRVQVDGRIRLRHERRQDGTTAGDDPGDLPPRGRRMEAGARSLEKTQLGVRLTQRTRVDAARSSGTNRSRAGIRTLVSAAESRTTSSLMMLFRARRNATRE